MFAAEPHASPLASSGGHSELSLTPYWLGMGAVCALFFVADLVCQWWLVRALWPSWFDSLSAKARVECANRIVSTIHAFTVSLGALYLLSHNPHFFSDITYGWSLQAMRLVTIYCGYCSYDVIITALHHHTLLPHFSIYFHHLLTLLMAVLCLSFRGGYLPLATCYLVNELSTPFLNFRWAFKKTSPHAGRAEEEDPSGADLEANRGGSLLRGSQAGELDAEDGALLSDDEDMDKLDAALENIKQSVLRRQERDQQVADITAAHSVGTPRGSAPRPAPAPSGSPRDRSVEPIALCGLEFASGHDLWACVNLVAFLLLFVTCRFMLNGYLSYQLILHATGRKPTGYPLSTGTTIFIHTLCYLFFLLNAFWLVGIQKVARRELAQMAKPKGFFSSSI